MMPLMIISVLPGDNAPARYKIKLASAVNKRLGLTLLGLFSPPVAKFFSSMAWAYWSRMGGW